MLLHRRRLALPALALLLASAFAAQAEPQPVQVELSFAPAVTKEPFTGRVLLFFSQRVGGEPRFGPDWFRPQPFFAMDVKGWKPEAPRIFQDHASFPHPLRTLPPGTYTVQAVMDFGLGREVGSAPGNGYSKPVRHEVRPGGGGVLKLTIDQVAKEQTFRETERVKLFEIESKLLSGFRKRPVKLRAGVQLPESFAKEPERKYPIVYDIPGFGGDHLSALRGRPRTRLGGEEFLCVFLDPDCPTGHSVFADSANNGPWGQALTEELIPALEAKFRAVGKPEARFVTGHSSGGWSSLWLQIAYPDFFGGCWSTAPDPVDFRDFQRINLYQSGANMFREESGADRPIARGRGGEPLIFYKPFSDMEEVMGHGGQLGSFEAVFSPKGEDGKPRKLWDRKTGAVDPQTAKAWEAYDINLVVKRRWPTLGPKLKGKVHVYMGEADTFYLEGATRLLGATLKELGSDAVVELFPGKDHGNLLDRAMTERIGKEMAEQYRSRKSSLSNERSER